MPEIRQDPLLGHHVVFAPERAQRPFEHSDSSQIQPLSRCPFCRGNENDTTDAVLELLAVDAESDRDWGVRVIPNRYPALVENAELSKHSSNCFIVEPGFGRHEVIIESPHHAISMTELPSSQFLQIVEAYWRRMRALREDQNIKHISLFKNDGAGAGASLEHVHSQLIATPFIGHRVFQELAASQLQFQHSRKCWFCEHMQHEERSSRIVFSTDDFCCWCPFASRFAGEMCLMPRRHRACFDDIDANELAAFAQALRECLQRLARAMPQVPFNFVIHTAPFEIQHAEHYHWHVEILPRVMGLAGFEIGAGCPINILLPEDAAAQLR